ncbi:hypothetical protein HYC85_029331 [Camellia sinensis]|uniref:SLC26A/SulP transporter domain-containing protein n=1 Tax=Camellia sinensis TaxID=4442 RepID=A0A7J7FXQ3_CAMSI|nr:hypothetical protein HYC85_029331 [Camellia sinensis]
MGSGFAICLPIFQWFPSYSIQLFRSDLISLTIASLAIPQGISYEKLANLSPIIRICSSFVPLLIYSVLGGSSHLGVGPVSIVSLAMGTMLGEMISSILEPDLYLRLAFTSTFFASVLQASSLVVRETSNFGVRPPPLETRLPGLDFRLKNHSKRSPDAKDMCFRSGPMRYVYWFLSISEVVMSKTFRGGFRS